MTTPPNIILIITDQQRWDTIRAHGATWMRTPTLDRLAAEGVSFTHCYTTSPVCVGARASLFSGSYPHMQNVCHNFDPWEPTWVRWLAEAGYHCVNIGKTHINPHDAKGGFHQRFVVENKDRALFLEEADRAFYDEWDKALAARGVVKPSRYTRFAKDPDEFRRSLGAFAWDLPEDLHSDNFIGNTALWWLDQRKPPIPCSCRSVSAALTRRTILCPGTWICTATSTSPSRSPRRKISRAKRRRSWRCGGSRRPATSTPLPGGAMQAARISCGWGATMPRISR